MSHRSRYQVSTILGRRAIVALVLCLAVAGVAVPAHSADSAWTGATDSLWSVTTNWNPAAPAEGDTALFNGAGNGNTTINLGGGVTATTVRFSTADAAAYTIGSGGAGSQSLTFDTIGSALTVDAGVVASQTVAANVVLSGTGAFVVTNNSGSSLAFTGAVGGNSTGTATFNVTGSGNTAVSGAITNSLGNVSLFKQGTGTLTLSGGATFAGNGTSTGNATSSAVFRGGNTVFNGGTYSVSGGEFVVGGQQTAGGAGFDAAVQLQSGTVLENISWLSIGRGNGIGGVSSDMVLNGNSVVNVANVSMGFNGGSGSNLPKGSLTLHDNAVLTVTGQNFYVGESAGSNMTLTVNDSARINMTSAPGGGGLNVGRGTGQGTLLIDGGNVKANWVDIGRGDNNAQTAVGTVTVRNGGVLTSDGDFRTGFAGNASSQSTVNISGGTVNVATSTERWMIIGRWDGTNSTINVDNGGTLNLNANTDMRFAQSGNTGTNVVNLNDGTITGFSDNGVTATGNSLVDMHLGNGATVSNTFNLNGGSLTVREVMSSDNSGNARFNFNGGLLRATGNTGNFVGLGGAGQRAQIRNGGARIDTNGFAVTIPEAIQHSDVAGDAAIDGGLTKLGSGTLTMTGVNAYTGNTTVSAGTLNVTTAASLGSGTISVENGAAFGVTVSGALNSKFTTSALTLGSSAVTVSLGDLGNPSVAPLAVTGSFAATGPSTINFTTLAPSAGTIPLISYGSFSDFANLSLGTVPTGVVASLVNNTAASTIDLVISSVALPRWNGNVSSVWDVGVTANWVDTLTDTPVTFANGNPATFNDLATGSTDVLINSTVSPGEVTINNETLPYGFAGTGAIAGPGGLTKRGAGSATIGTANTYTGTTTISGGTLSISSLANVGTASSIGAGSAGTGSLVFNGGRLVYTGGAVTTNRGYSVTGGASVFEVQSNVTMSGGVAASGGTFEKAGAGTLTLTGASNVLSGGVVSVSSGTLALVGPGPAASSQIVSNAGDLRIGTSPDFSGHLVMSNSTATLGGGFSVGRGDGISGNTSTFSLANSSISATYVSMGYDNGLAGYLANQSGTLNDSTIQSNGNTDIGESGGSTATLTLSGTSRMTSSNRTYLGRFPLATGTMIVEGNSSFTTGGWLGVGGEGTGTLIVRDNATFTVNGDFNVADIAAGNGTFEMGGSAVVSGTRTYVGKGVGSVGVATINGGTFTGGNSDVFQIGQYGTGTWNQVGGTTNATGWVAIGRYAGSLGELTVGGGTFDQVTADRLLLVGEEGTGTLTVNGGAVNAAAAGGLAVGWGATGYGVVNLNGGTLTARRVQAGTTGGTSEFNFNGGVLKAGANANGAAFMTGLGTVLVQAGGATIDSNGQDITIAQTLGDGGGGGLTKLGGGVLTLSGANAYTGPTTVTAGGLAVDTGTFVTSAYGLASGTSFDVAVVGSANTQVSAANFTLGGLNTLGFDLGNFGNPTSAPLNVVGALTTSGAVTINLDSSRPQLGQFPVIAYGSRTGAGSYSLGTLPAGVTAQLVNNTAGNSIDILITQLASRSWNGVAGGIPNGTWDVGTTANWVIPPSDPSTFSNGDEAVFDDTALGTSNVVLNTTVTPNGVIIDNQLLTYTISGTGAIAGGNGLLKKGTGDATISTANTFTGGVRIEAGRLIVPSLGNGGAAGPLGAASAVPGSVVLAGGTLAYSGATGTSDRGFSQAAASSFEVVQADAVLTLTGRANASTGNFTKTGPGRLVLSAATNTLASPRVSQGTLALVGTGADRTSQTTNVTGEIWVGLPTALDAGLAVTNATLNVGSWMSIGRGHGSAAATATATFTDAAVTVGNLSTGYDGGTPGGLATQVVTIADSTFTNNGNTNVAESAGSTSTITISGSSVVTSANRTMLGYAGATGNLVLEGAARYSSGGWFSIGQAGVGTFTAKDNSQFTVANDFNVSDLAGSDGTMTISGNAAVSGGAAYVGKAATSVGRVTMSGGTFTAGNNNVVQIGQYGEGIWTQSGGTANLSGWMAIGRYSGSVGSVTVSGGSFNQIGSDRALFVSEDGAGTLTVSGTGVVNVGAVANGLTLTNNATGSSTVNLDGGRITTSIVRDNGGLGTFNFNGGTLQAAATSQTNFMTGLDAANVLAGGAVIDSNGRDITIGQDLLDGGTGGGLSKIGTGTLTLAGASTYTGATSITAGTLSLTGTISASAATAATAGTLAGSGTVGSLAVNVGGTVSPGVGVGTLTTTQGVTWASGGSLNWQIADAAGGAGTGWDLLTVGGALAISSTSAEPFAVNLWSLSSASPVTGGDAANFDASQSYTWTIASTTGGITGFAADKFVVRIAAANGTSGFTNPVGTGGFAVAQSGNDLQLVYSPGAPTNDIIIDVPSGSQTQAQAGYPTIATADSVTKIGAGTVVFDAANSYSGPTTISAGTLQVANANGLAATAVTVDSGATLAVASGTTMKSPSVIVDGGTLSGAALAVNNSTGIRSLAINAGTISGSPVVTIASAGQMSLVQDARVTVAIGGLSIDQAGGGGRLDLGAGQVSLAAGGISAADLRADIIAGRNGGAWNGTTGIMSSTAAASGGTRAVGYVVAGDGSARVSYAAAGDVDLSGAVNVFDLVSINSGGKYGTGQSAVWSQGDFNYDGVTNVFDLVGINTAAVYGQGNYFPAAPSASGFGSVAAVPEPASWLLLGGGLGGLALARRLARGGRRS